MLPGRELVAMVYNVKHHSEASIKDNGDRVSATKLTTVDVIGVCLASVAANFSAASSSVFDVIVDC